MKKKDGFTFVELLAAIVILSILAVITTPLILGLVEGNKDKTNLLNANLIVDSVSNYYKQSLLNATDYPIDDETNILSTLSYKGEGPEALSYPGYGAYANNKGQVAIAIKYDDKCYRKFYSDATLSVIDYSLEQCVALLYTEDTSGGTGPDLSGTSLIPIIYDETVGSPTYRTWVKADTLISASFKWFDYGARRWGNAALVTEATQVTYSNAAPGTQVAAADVLAYLVWIPRYSYTIKTPFGNGGVNTLSPGSIDIKFQDVYDMKDTGTASYSGAEASNYRTHPAFTFGGQELSGIWVGKFETTGTAANPTVLPNLTSLRSQNVSTQFDTAQVFNTYGLGSTSDAHMMKESDWGAAVYLSQSVFGRCTSSTTCPEVYVNNSTSYYTGRSANSSSVLIPITGCTARGTYSYDGRTCSSNDCSSEGFAADVTRGTKASTTGNIYGIYDMNGGTYEYVMAGYKGENSGEYPAYSGLSSVSSSNSGYNGWLIQSGTFKTDGKDWPASKYFEPLIPGAYTLACGGVCYGRALSETMNWYSDIFTYNSDYSWTLRSGQCEAGVTSGIFFYYLFASGGSNPTPSVNSSAFRVVITKPV